MSAVIEEKFGRVFVFKRNPISKILTGDGELLEGAAFSNFSLRIFHGDCELETYNGVRFHVGILGQRIKTPFPLGFNIVPDQKILRKAILKEADVVKQRNITSKKDVDKSTQRPKVTHCSIYWAFMSSDGRWTENDFPFLTNMYVPLDDILEKYQDTAFESGNCRRPKCPHKLTSRIGAVFSDILKMEDGHEDDHFQRFIEDPMFVLKSASLVDEENNIKFSRWTKENTAELLGTLQVILKNLSALRKAACETGLKYKCSSIPFLNYTCELINALSLEYSREWCNKFTSEENAEVMLPSFITVRKINIAASYFAEAVMLQQGISLRNCVRETTLFKLIHDKIGVHTLKLNDLFSFQNDMDSGGNSWRSNEACILHKVKGIPIADALTKMANDANQALEQLEVLCECFREAWKGSEDQDQVNKFVGVMLQHIASSIQYHVLSGRYHKNLGMDCYIYEI